LVRDVFTTTVLTDTGYEKRDRAGLRGTLRDETHRACRDPGFGAAAVSQSRWRAFEAGWTPGLRNGRPTTQRFGEAGRPSGLARGVQAGQAVVTPEDQVAPGEATAFERSGVGGQLRASFARAVARHDRGGRGKPRRLAACDGLAAATRKTGGARAATARRTAFSHREPPSAQAEIPVALDARRKRRIGSKLRVLPIAPFRR
jgi:hypothetical protein